MTDTGTGGSGPVGWTEPVDPTQTKIPHPDGPKTTGKVPLLQRIKKYFTKQSTETGE